MSILDKLLMADLFPAVMAAKAKQSETDSYVDGDAYFFPYKVEELKTRLSAYYTSLLLAGLSYSVTHDLPPRVEIHGGHSIEERKSFMERLHNEPETEALLILKVANTDAYLREVIEERAGIREYDAGLSGSVFLAILGDISSFIEEKRRVKTLTWEHELQLLGL